MRPVSVAVGGWAVAFRVPRRRWPAQPRAPSRLLTPGRRFVGEWRTPSARAGSRATPRQVVPDRREACAAASLSGNRYYAVFRWGLVRW